MEQMSISPYKYIAIEGCIGAGKTELAKRLHQEWNGEVVLECFAENKFLPLFYQNPQLYAFHLELTFLTDRYEQIYACQKEIRKREKFVISDYFFDKSLIFSDNNLHGDELSLYQKLFHHLHSHLQKPDFLLYLYKSAERLLENIKKRGRPYEQNIQQQYLEEIQSKYLSYLEKIGDYPVLIVNTENIEFLGSQSDYEFIKSLFSDKYDNKNYYLNF